MTATPKSDAIKGDLYDLLVSKLPACLTDAGNLSVADLARGVEMSPEGVYRWLRSDEISKRGRKRLIEYAHTAENIDKLEGGIDAALTEDDLRPFL